MKDMETGQRGFLLTRQERYLEPYNTAQAKMPQKLAAVQKLTEDNKSQQVRIKELTKLIAERNEEFSETIDLHARMTPIIPWSWPPPRDSRRP